MLTIVLFRASAILRPINSEGFIDWKATPSVWAGQYRSRLCLTHGLRGLHNGLVQTGNGIPRLRAARELQGRSLRSVAREAQIDPTFLSRVERGLQKPSLRVLLSLADALKLKDLAKSIRTVLGD